MYTSGSTGIPKGVILLHSNLLATMKAFCDSTKIFEDDVMIGFLPLAHVFELLVESVCLLMGIPIGYSSALTMLDTSSKIKKGTKGDASVLRPTCMTSVPVSIMIFQIQYNLDNPNHGFLDGSVTQTHIWTELCML